MKKYTNHDGTEVTLQLRKLSINLLDMVLACPIEQADSVAHLFIKPEGRTVDEVRQLFESLDEESKFEVFSQGWELNESNFDRFEDLRKKHSARSGRISPEQMLEKLLADPAKLAELTKSLSLPQTSSEVSTTPEPDSSATASA